MARRGRKPAPKELKILSGSRADRIPIEAPAAIPGLPPIPDWLESDAYAAAEWARVVEDLEALGVLSRTDWAALVCYVAAWSRWRRAEAELLKPGAFTVATETGEKSNPVVAVANAAHAQVTKLLAELGLTPTARARVRSASPEAPRDSLEAFLSTGG